MDQQKRLSYETVMLIDSMMESENMHAGLPTLKPFNGNPASKEKQLQAML